MYGKYANDSQNVENGTDNLSKFYETFGDTLTTDITSYPKARIYGQDVFRNNELSFYQKALDAKAPS
ncbi:MAG: hypothetical protein HN535_06160 [Flavobacteriales bacterium]|nr:hypothetical protein [Flavobacteriales bacterium]